MLKKLIVFILATIFMVFLQYENNKPLFSTYADTYEIYKSGSSSGKILAVDRTAFYFISGIKGESAKLKKDDFNLEEFITDFSAEIVFIEEIEEGTSFYAQTDKIKYQRKVNGQNINLHIFMGKEEIVVGAPIIYGSF